MVREVDVRRRVGGGQIVPATLHPGERPLAGDAQRVVPRRAILDARVPDDEHGEDGEEQRRNRQPHRIGAALQRPDQEGQRREEHGKPETGNAARTAQLLVTARGVLLRPPDVVGGHEACLRADMFSRQ